MMKVQREQAESNQKVDKGTEKKIYTKSDIMKKGLKSAYAIDISGKVMDNSAYKGQGRTTEEIMQKVSQKDLQVQKNYMTVMSNFMSVRDFSKMEEEGFQPADMEGEEFVTFVDKIKMTLLAAGVEITGYNDDFSAKEMEAAGGNAQAAAIQRKLKEYDLPPSEKNQKEVSEALEEASKMQPLEEVATKYMVENSLEPSIEHIYKAQFSAAGDVNRQGRGYFSDNQGAYYAKKADTIEWNKLEQQVEKRLENMGEETSSANKEAAKWLIEKGIPFTDESFALLKECRELTLPQEESAVLDKIVRAMANGQNAKSAVLTQQPYFYEDAVQLQEQVAEITDEAVEEVVRKGRKLSIRELASAQREIHLAANIAKNDKVSTMETTPAMLGEIRSAKLQMEEIRLHMTADANLRLMRRGFAIQTADLSAVIEELKKSEADYNRILFGEEDSEVGNTKNKLYQETSDKITQMKGMPAALIGKVATVRDSATLNYAHAQGSAMQQRYAQAGESYETLSTAPRKDLGDSMQKAFRNVDSLLEEQGIRPDEANRRAVRILGYNEMEINEENIYRVKEADSAVQKIVDKLTPGTTLAFIREGINPLEISLTELEQKLDEIARENHPDSEKYSKFLYQMEQSKQVTKEEKEAYIGMYRLLRQVEKSDGAVIGSLVNQGAEINFKNLLSAVRTSKSQGIDYTISDKEGAREVKPSRDNTISQQITNYYTRLATELTETFDPEKFTGMNVTENITLDQLSDVLQGKQDNAKSDTSSRNEEMEQFKQVSQAKDQTYRTLIDYQQPVTPNQVETMESMVSQEGKFFQQLADVSAKAKNLSEKGKGLEDSAKEAMQDIAKSMTDKETMSTAYESVKEVINQLTSVSIETGTMTSKDMKAIAMLYRQVSMAVSMAKEENYYVPIPMNDSITTVNLKIIRGSGGESKVTTSMETTQYGKMDAEFTVKDGKVSGFVVGNKSEGMIAFEGIITNFRQELSISGKTVEHINFAFSDQVPSESLDRIERVDANTNTAELYQVAKAFLSALQRN